MSAPYRTNAPPAGPRPMTPEEEMKLLLLDADCRDVLRPVSVAAAIISPIYLVDVGTILFRRWRMVRRLRAKGVDVKR